jgi:hypothetical protein
MNSRSQYAATLAALGGKSGSTQSWQKVAKFRRRVARAGQPSARFCSFPASESRLRCHSSTGDERLRGTWKPPAVGTPARSIGRVETPVGRAGIIFRWRSVVASASSQRAFHISPAGRVQSDGHADSGTTADSGRGSAFGFLPDRPAARIIPREKSERPSPSPDSNDGRDRQAENDRRDLRSSHHSEQQQRTRRS